MNIEKERVAFEERFQHLDLDFVEDVGYCELETQYAWAAWWAATERAEAKLEDCVVVPEHNIQLKHGEESFEFDLIDLLRRSLKSSKVLKTRENWSHVSKMLGVGSTVAMLICKEMQVEPNSTQMIVEAARGGK